ncbi:MAG TPA: hypothetical protein VIW71_07165, partial [Streptomyces sp.]
RRPPPAARRRAGRAVPRAPAGHPRGNRTGGGTKGDVIVWVPPQYREEGVRAHPLPVMGISTGGYGAARPAPACPDRFAAGAALAPDDPARGHRSPLWPPRATRPDTDPLVESSLQDPESPPEFGEPTSRAVTAPNAVTTLRIEKGGHNRKTRGRMVPAALTWVSARMEAPRAVPLAASATP